MSASKGLTVDNINPNVKKLEYAVRGPIVTRALDLERELKEGAKKPYKEVIKCNIGDCHATGQKPITFLRQVLALLSFPELMNDPKFPDDAKSRAKRILDSCSGHSVGSYSVSTGVEIIRRDCAEYIKTRDQLESNWEDIFLATGASEAIKSILELVATQRDDSGKAGIMIPIPQYPLYSATNAQYNAYQIGYYLDESKHWNITESQLEDALKSAQGKCQPRAICVINPGNPTGQVLTKQTMEMVLKFADRHNLLVLADEVYQFNVYAPELKFISFKRALHDLGGEVSKRVMLASFMSCSKGYMGECGLRGGYCELVNWPADVKAQLYKCLSARLCSSVLGQAALGVVVNPPRQGEPSFKLFDQEKSSVLTDLKMKAQLVTETLNKLPGFSCNAVQGAMYAFPKIQLPEKAIQAAKSKNQEPDFFYCWNLLEETGICVVPGSGFCQSPGTYHFRITILPSVEQMKKVMLLIEQFHKQFMQKYQ